MSPTTWPNDRTEEADRSRESFCELNFYIIVLFKCKKDRLFIIAYFMFLCPFLRKYLQ